MFFEKQSKWLFIGDSVTDAGRDYQRRVGSFDSLGQGYVAIIAQALTALYPEKEIMVINQGINGHKVTDLEARWHQDVLRLNPDYVSIMIGINDVWRHFDQRFVHPNDLVDLETFRRTYQDLVEQTKSQVKQIVLMSPFMFENNLSDPMFAKLAEYQAVVKQLARENNLLYVDIQAAVNQYLKVQSSYILSNDRVHPNQNGHFLLAHTWLKALQFDWRSSDGN